MAKEAARAVEKEEEASEEARAEATEAEMEVGRAVEATAAATAAAARAVVATAKELLPSAARECKRCTSLSPEDRASHLEPHTGNRLLCFRRGVRASFPRGSDFGYLEASAARAQARPCSSRRIRSDRTAPQLEPQAGHSPLLVERTCLQTNTLAKRWQGKVLLDSRVLLSPTLAIETGRCPSVRYFDSNTTHGRCQLRPVACRLGRQRSTACTLPDRQDLGVLGEAVVQT